MAPQRGRTITLNSEVFFQTFWPRQVGYTLYMDFGDNIIFIDGVISSQIIRHVVKT